MLQMRFSREKKPAIRSLQIVFPVGFSYIVVDTFETQSFHEFMIASSLPLTPFPRFEGGSSMGTAVRFSFSNCNNV